MVWPFNQDKDEPLSKGEVALNTFLASVAGWMAGLVAIDAGYDAMLGKRSFGESIKNHFSNKWTWILEGGVAAAFGLWDANKAYKKVERAEQQQDKLTVENIVLRDQLKKSGQAPLEIVQVKRHDTGSRNFADREITSASYADKITAEKEQAAEAGPVLH